MNSRRLMGRSLPHRPPRVLGIAHTRRVSVAGLCQPQAKLSRKSNQIARGRIRRFESDMPSHAVGSLWAALLSDHALASSTTALSIKPRAHGAPGRSPHRVSARLSERISDRACRLSACALASSRPAGAKIRPFSNAGVQTIRGPPVTTHARPGAWNAVAKTVIQSRAAASAGSLV
jgi:hypothetical protein